jgi:hypothetical protein
MEASTELATLAISLINGVPKDLPGIEFMDSGEPKGKK